GGQCRMTIRDTAGKELIDLYSQKDMDTTVLNNMTTVVNGPVQSNVVSKGCQTNTVQKSIKITALKEHIALKAHTAIGLNAETSGIKAEAHTSLELVAKTKCVKITGKTAVRLEAGDSSLELKADGTILLNGVVVKIVGTTSVDLNPVTECVDPNLTTEDPNVPVLLT
ncbi:MAG TPA: hypothetical protein DCY59_14080, partial [Micrococcaceae bacterium]|nr:hypothetical protein [Micrococcaceae bacterium]